MLHWSCIILVVLCSCTPISAIRETPPHFKSLNAQPLDHRSTVWTSAPEQGSILPKCLMQSQRHWKGESPGRRDEKRGCPAGPGQSQPLCLISRTSLLPSATCESSSCPDGYVPTGWYKRLQSFPGALNGCAEEDGARKMFRGKDSDWKTNLGLSGLVVA